MKKGAKNNSEKGKEEIDYVKWLFELSNKNVAIAGGKGASLAEMYNEKFPVPPAFVVTAQAFEKFISEIKKDIDHILKSTDVEDTKQLNESSRKIRKLIENQAMPKEMEEEIVESYEILGSEKRNTRIGEDAMNILKITKEPVFVAVRSSATTEDLAEASFAGQQETFLNIKGKTQLLNAIKKCSSSLYTPRAIYYREKRGFRGVKALLSVVVQRMINSDKSGVMFTKNPIHEEDNVVIEAVFGLGEGIVSGKIKPDNYTINRNLEILDQKIADKKKALIRSSSGETEEVRLTEKKSQEKVLTDSEIQRIAEIGLKIEKHYGKPQDIEFAIENKEIYIVQSRPITTTAKGKSKELDGKVLLTGLPASPGVASGKVRVVKSMDDLEKVQKGDILVTEMTNPDMVVTMQKSDAIVTDEGGATCFAEDTKVLTNMGFMNIKDAYQLVNNNRELILLSYDSRDMKAKWKKILSSGRRKSKTIKVSCSQTGRVEDNTLELTSDHKMITFEDRNLVKRPIFDVLKNEEMVCLVDKLPKNGIMNDYKKAYLIGALLSDGYYQVQKHHTGNPRRGRIIFTQKEIPEKAEFIKTVNEYFKEVFGENFKSRKVFSNSSINGRIISGVATHFISNKLVPASEVLRISQNLDRWALGLDESSSLNFLAGLIDGDGCFLNNRLHLYASKENVLQGVVLSCLNLGFFPQITRNRDIYHIQILERMNDILNCTKRVKGIAKEKVLGNKLLSARQILGDIIEAVNLNGRIKPYVDNNLLIDSKKLGRIFSLCDEKNKKELIKVINSKLRMQKIKKICDAGETFVYNLEVEADNELDHNFVVFTKKYTPLLVSNSHAAIVSREMGIPCVVGTRESTSLLKDGQIVTVDGASGKVYEGEVGEEKKKEILPVVETKTKIKVLVDLPSFAERAAKSKCKEVGLLRLEGIIAESGKHPLMFLAENRIDDYSKVLERGIKKIAEHFMGVWVRASDIRSDEFRNLEGSPKEIEVNPMLGFHGVRFSLKNKEILEAEIKAIRNVAQKFPDKKIGIMFPQIISVEETKEVRKVFEKFKTDNMEFGIMVETPAACQIIEELCGEEIDFISFGTNDLTQYTLAVDRGNENCQHLYNETHPAILRQIEKVINVCKERKVETSICGQAASKKEMAKFLVEKGIDSLSVNADAAHEISKVVREIERQKSGNPKEEQSDNEPGEIAEIENEINDIAGEIEQINKEEQTSKGLENIQKEYPDVEIGIDVFNPGDKIRNAPVMNDSEGITVDTIIGPIALKQKKNLEEYPDLGINLDFLKFEVPEPQSPFPQGPSMPFPLPKHNAKSMIEKEDISAELEKDEEIIEAVKEMRGVKDEEDIDIPLPEKRDENVLDIF